MQGFWRGIEGLSLRPGLGVGRCEPGQTRPGAFTFAPQDCPSWFPPRSDTCGEIKPITLKARETCPSLSLASGAMNASSTSRGLSTGSPPCFQQLQTSVPEQFDGAGARPEPAFLTPEPGLQPVPASRTFRPQATHVCRDRGAYTDTRVPQQSRTGIGGSGGLQGPPWLKLRALHPLS